MWRLRTAVSSPRRLRRWSATVFVPVASVDQYAKAKVLNFLKRHDLSIPDLPNIESVTVDGRSLFRAEYALPLPNGTRVMAIGFGGNAEDAHLAVAAHATQIVDASGYCLFTLRSMQRRHSAAALEEGRWAPTDSDTVPQNPTLPDPLCFEPQATEEEELVFCDVSVLSSSLGPTSTAAIDSNALHRVRQWFSNQELPFEESVSTSWVGDMVCVCIVVETRSISSRGVAGSRATALSLAAMHFEQLLAFEGIQMFSDAEQQALHYQCLVRAGFVDSSPPPPLRERLPAQSVTSEEGIRIARHLGIAAPPGSLFQGSAIETECLEDIAADVMVLRREGSAFVATYIGEGETEALGVGATSDEAARACRLHASLLSGLTTCDAFASTFAGVSLLSESNNSPKGPEALASGQQPVRSERSEKPVDGLLVTAEDLDGTSRSRVQSFLKRKKKACSVELQPTESGFTALLPLTVANRETTALGVAATKKDAEAACFVHAERIIDASGSLLFNLPGLQKRHAERVAASGRWAARTLSEAKSDFEVPPHIEVTGESVEVLEPPAADLPWTAYVDRCTAFIADLEVFELNTGHGFDLPATTDFLVDVSYRHVSQIATDRNVKGRLSSYCQLMGVDYPTSWTSKSIGSLANRRVYTEVILPGFEHVKAFGVAPSKDESQRRATMHAMELLQRLDPDWKMFEEAEETGKRTKRDTGSFDRSLRSLTAEGKLRVVQLFTLCCGLPPPSVDHRQRRLGNTVGYVTTVTVVDHAGNQFEGAHADAGTKLNEPRAFAALYSKLMDGVPSFRSLSSLVRTHPHLDPDHVVSVTLSPEIAEEIRGLQTVSSAGTESCTIATESSTSSLLDSLISDPLRRSRANAVLAKQREKKLASEQYQLQFVQRRESLAIWEHRDEILETISRNSVTILCGTTGCGKTTQVPQYLLDSFTDNGRGGDCQIMVTQPRRLNAVSIATRIAAERLECIGETVGYTIRLESRPGSSINFCTSGVLLRLIQNRPNLEGISHLIIDEIHERDINSDFLLILVKDLVMRRPDLRVVLMSATLQSEAFRAFFEGDVPIINVHGFVHPVQELFLEDMQRIAQDAEFSTKWFKPEEEVSIVKREDPEAKHGLLEAPGDIDFDAVAFTVCHAVSTIDDGGSVLVFLPGWDEIQRSKDILIASEHKQRLHVLPLHSSVSTEEQAACFASAPEGKTKVVLATNIAESGVTIDDVSVVIDVGRAKEKSFVVQKGRTVVGRNEVSTMSRFLTVLASRANSTQRRGRAGRTRPGRAIRLITKTQFDELYDFQTPEIHRTPLDSLCLQILALELGSPPLFLQRALDPPSSETVRSAMKRLTDLGAVDQNGEITVLGKRLAMLPVAPHVGKMVLLGTGLGCLDSILTLASCFDADPFSSQREMREVVKLSREEFSNGSQSDHLTALNAYNTWANLRMEKTDEEMNRWLNDSALALSSLQQISKYKLQYREILSQSRFIPTGDGELIKGTILADPAAPIGVHSPVSFHRAGGSSVSTEIVYDVSEASASSADIGLVKAVLCAGLYPNVAIFRDRRRFRNKMENVLHPQSSSLSASFQEEDVTNPFFVYDELLKSDARVILRGLTNVSFWAIVLLGTSTKTQIQFRDDLNLAIIDDWIIFRVDSESLELIYHLKDMLAEAMERRFRNPEDSENNSHLARLQGLVRSLVNQSMRPNELTDRLWSDDGSIVERARPSDTTTASESAVRRVSVDPEAVSESSTVRVVGRQV